MMRGARALPQLVVWDFWRSFARARAESSLGNRYLKEQQLQLGSPRARATDPVNFEEVLTG
jgi:hypothetical protein